VLIIGPNFFFINESISNAFIALGWESYIDAMIIQFIRLKDGISGSIKFSFNREKIKEKSSLLYNTYIRKRF
jgi:hypothetical protein